jgi:hypothetical protein
MKKINIWITWHRYIKLKQRYWDVQLVKKNIFDNLDKELSKFKNTEFHFHLWLADGVDNIVWKYCIKNNIPYTLYIPFWTKKWFNKSNIKSFYDFELEFCEFLKAMFYSMDTEEEAFEIYRDRLSTIGTIWNWYKWRNQDIIDNADILFAWWDKEDTYSWTYQTMNFWKKKWIDIINIISL